MAENLENSNVFSEWLRSRVTTPERRRLLADAAGVDVSNVSRWLTGANLPGLDKAPAIAHGLGVDADSIRLMIAKGSERRAPSNRDLAERLDALEEQMRELRAMIEGTFPDAS